MFTTISFSVNAITVPSRTSFSEIVDSVLEYKSFNSVLSIFEYSSSSSAESQSNSSVEAF